MVQSIIIEASTDIPISNPAIAPADIYRLPWHEPSGSPFGDKSSIAITIAVTIPQNVKVLTGSVICALKCSAQSAA